MVESIGRLALEEDRRSGEIVLWADTAASMQRLLIGLAIATLIGLAFGLTLGSFRLRRGPRYFRRCPLDDSADGDPAHSVHRVRIGRAVEGRADRVRHRRRSSLQHLALSVDSLPREQLIKAQSLGASTWQIAIRVVLPQIMPRLIEALRLSARAGVSLPHLGGGDRRRPRARLSHLPGAALSLDGCHPALTSPGSQLLAYLMDFALAWLARRGFCLGLCGRTDECDLVARVWVEYGEQIVLERVNLTIAAGTFLSVVGPSGAGKSTFLRLILGQEGRRAARSSSTASRCRRARA